MKSHLRAIALGGAIAAFAVSWPAASRAQGQEHTAVPPTTPAAPDSIRLSPFPPAELPEETLEVLVAGAGFLFPLLPHEPGGQPGSAVERYALLGSVVDSLDGRGPLALSLEEGETLRAGLEKRAIPTRFCGAVCAGAFGEAALSFQVPRIEGGEAAVRIRSFWALAQLPGQRPDRVLYRTDEIRLRKADGRWQLAGHSKLGENFEFIVTPGWDPSGGTAEP